jgi:hypothetical protein
VPIIPADLLHIRFDIESQCLVNHPENVFDADRRLNEMRRSYYRDDDWLAMNHLTLPSRDIHYSILEISTIPATGLRGGEGQKSGMDREDRQARERHDAGGIAGGGAEAGRIGCRTTRLTELPQI